MDVLKQGKTESETFLCKASLQCKRSTLMFDAVTLSFIDIMFGTFYYRPGTLPERLGVVDPNAYPKSNEFWKVMMLPFEGEIERRLIDAPAAGLQ